MEINVEDINDNRPIFVGLPYNFVFNSNTNIGDVVCEIQAVDMDAGLNGKVFYSILSGNDKEIFNMNPMTGRITLAKEIKLDTLNESLNFTLVVLAKDLGTDLVLFCLDLFN